MSDPSILTGAEENDLASAFAAVNVSNEALVSNELSLEADAFEEERCLFIGDVARGLTEEQLREPFDPYGVANVEIKRDRVTGYSLGYGFIWFKTKLDAANAKKSLHRATIGGRQIRLGWAQKNTNLFVGDLDGTVSSEQLREVFRRYGPLYEEETFVKNRNYGFVRYRLRRHAEQAKREMHGKSINAGSRPIRIGWGDANYQRHCVHIQFDPSHSENLTESEVIAKFEEHGTVMSVNLPRNQGSLRGFGFIYYDDTDAGEASAAKAITSLNNVEISGVRIQCNFGKKPSNKKVKPVTRGKVGGINPSGAERTGRGRGQQALFPVQVMMPVGPQGSWQPVQYMMTPQQAHQFYSSIQSTSSYHHHHHHHPSMAAQQAPNAPLAAQPHLPASPTPRDPSPQHQQQQVFRRPNPSRLASPYVGAFQ